MTGDVGVLAVKGAGGAGGGCHIFSGCGYPAPSLDSFMFRPLFTIGSFHFTKPMLIAVLCGLVVIVFFWAAFHKPQLIPRGVQNIGEVGILLVRDQILRPSLGKRGDSYLPFLVSLFFYHLADEPDGAHPGPPVPDHVPDRLRLAARLPRLLSLPVPGVQAPGVPRLHQEHDPLGRAQAHPGHPDPDRAAPVLRRPAVHPGRAAVRQHVRRAPAAADLHTRELVPGERCPSGCSSLRARSP